MEGSLDVVYCEMEPMFFLFFMMEPWTQQQSNQTTRLQDRTSDHIKDCGQNCGEKLPCIFTIVSVFIQRGEGEVGSTVLGIKFIVEDI